MNFQAITEKIGEGMMRGIDLAVGEDVAGIIEIVEAQKRLHPEIAESPEMLSDRITGKKNWYAAAISFVYGLGGVVTIVPNIVHIWRVHGRLVLTVAYIYGYDLKAAERREEIALCFALSSGNEGVKRILREAGMLGVRKALLTEAMKEVIKALPRKIITIAGEKSLVNVAKLVPIFGGLVCGVMDFFSTKGIGAAAKEYYS